MDFAVRDLVRGDSKRIVELDLRAWECVFDSLRAILDTALFESLRRTDWRSGQASEIRKTISATDTRTWVVDADGDCRGFITASLPPEANTGKIVMVETGGPPGHTAARATYERAGLTAPAMTTPVPAPCIMPYLT